MAVPGGLKLTCQRATGAHSLNAVFSELLERLDDGRVTTDLVGSLDLGGSEGQVTQVEARHNDGPFVADGTCACET
ncbi:hypothetical protein F750_3793 [Streptomyces sp. PAMC 26508]|nr:hypothetical protein F750_3793 [Streptomyces sp. PAMC 26508]